MRISRQALHDWLPSLLWMALIFSASNDAGSAQHSSRLFEPLIRWLFPLMVQARVDEIHYLFRKCAHLAEFALLAILVWRAIRHATPNRPPPWRWSQAALALLFVALYAASDEFHQMFIPGRCGQVSDVFVDASGGAIGLGLLWLVGKLRKRW